MTKLITDDQTKLIITGSPCRLEKAVTEYIVAVKIHKSERVRNMGAVFDASANMLRQEATQTA